MRVTFFQREMNPKVKNHDKNDKNGKNDSCRTKDGDLKQTQRRAVFFRATKYKTFYSLYKIFKCQPPQTMEADL